MSLAKEFFDRFKGLDRAHGTYTIREKNVQKNKMEGKAATVSTPPTVDLWKRHLDGEQGLGIIPITDDGHCYWGAIDIDEYDLDLFKLVEEINAIKLPLICCRTKSGGAHLYLFLKEAIDAKIVRSKLMEWAIALGYPNVEVFPKQVRLASREDCGNWLNMPYFANEKTNRYALSKELKHLTSEEFLKYSVACSVDEIELQKITTTNNDDFDDAPPCLQHLCSRGFPKGTRNKGLFNLAVFAKQKYPDEWKKKVEDFNLKYMQDPLNSTEVLQTVKSVDRKTYFYTCNDSPISEVCSKQICLTRKYGIGNASDDLGVVINGLTKIDTAPPTWFVSVNGMRIEIENTDDLVSQMEFRKICVEKLNLLPNRIKQEVWERTIRNLLERVDIIEAPEDASSIGQLLHLVEEFILTRAQASTRDEVLLGKPYVENGMVHFRSIDLGKYLDQRRFAEIKGTKKIWNILRSKGATSKVFSVKGKSCRVWAMPNIEAQKEEFDVPDVKKKEEF